MSLAYPPPPDLPFQALSSPSNLLDRHCQNQPLRLGWTDFRHSTFVLYSSDLPLFILCSISLFPPCFAFRRFYRLRCSIRLVTFFLHCHRYYERHNKTQGFPFITVARSSREIRNQNQHCFGLTPPAIVDFYISGRSQPSLANNLLSLLQVATT